MFRFANPEYLYWLFLVPVVGMIYLYFHVKTRKRVKVFGDWNLLRGSNSVEIWLAIDLIGGSDWELDTFYEDGHVKVSLGIELGKQSYVVLFRDSIDGVLGYYN